MNQSEGNQPDGKPCRHGVLTATVAGAANLFKTPVYGQTQAPAPGHVIGANDRVRVGYIGVGSSCAGTCSGQFHLSNQRYGYSGSNVEQAAVCDLSRTRRDQALEIIGRNVTSFEHYEDLLTLKDIDAVIIATPDHWKAKISLDALAAGKHVYCEGPMARHLPEAIEVYDKAKSTGLKYQTGTQSCSAEAWHKAAALIGRGDIGRAVWAQGNFCRNSRNAEWNVPIPAWVSERDLNWDKWQGPVRDKQKFNPEAYIRWRKYYRYSSGMLGAFVYRRLLPLMLATGNPEFPSRVVCLGGTPVNADLEPPFPPRRDVPEHVQVLVEFPSGFTITLVASAINARSPGFAIYGHKATLEIGALGERIALIPEKPYSHKVDVAAYGSLNPTENVPEHEKNWFDAIRNNTPLNADVDLAIRGQVVLSLAEMSERLSMMCLWDEKTRMVKTGDGKEIEPITYGSIKPS